MKYARLHRSFTCDACDKLRVPRSKHLDVIADRGSIHVEEVFTYMCIFLEHFPSHPNPFLFALLQSYCRKMPRIDPHQLLKTLGVLLCYSGGIRSSEEVLRIVQLMQKFSRKLVSKCIYVQILKATKVPLLDEFLDADGWALLNTWFADAIKSKNWPFANEMLELFLHCPITAARLRDNVEANQAPKLINQLRQASALDDDIRKLADKVYNKWLMVVSSDKENGDNVSDVNTDSENSCEDKTAKVTFKAGASAVKEEDKGAGAENGPISLLQSLADEVSENIKKEEEGKSDDVREKKGSDKKQRHHEKHHLHSHRDKDRSSKEKHNGSSQKDSKAREKEREDRRKRRDEREKERDRDKKRFRPDRRDEVDPSEKQRIKEIARRLKEEEQSKKDKDTLSKIGVGTTSTLSKIPRIPKKSNSSDEKKGLSFEDMLGGLDSKPKTVKTPMNRNKTASLLEGFTKSSSPSSNKAKESSSSVASSSSSSSSKHTSHKKEGGGSHSDRHKSSAVTHRRDTGSSSSSHGSKKDSTHQSSTKKPDPEKKPTKLSFPEKRRSSDNDSPKVSKATHNFSESSGFMDAIFSSMSKEEPRKKKRRLSETDPQMRKPQEKTDSSEGHAPKARQSTPEKEESEDKADPVPAFSFYKDTLDETHDTEEEKKSVKETKNAGHEEDEDSKRRSSPPPSETENNDDVSDKKNTDADNDLPFKEPDSLPREVKGILVYHRGKDKRNKAIKWKAETDLVSVRYFELDEDERVNVNKIKFENMREMELKMEKAAIKSKGAVEEDQTQWYTPIRVDVDNREPFEPGSKSEEKDIQYAREKNVLQALYFNKAMTPPSPAEPDPEMFKRREPAVIPLDDVEGGEDSVTDYSKKVQWPEPKINAVDQQANLESAFSLPPALSNLLNSVNIASILPKPSSLSQEEQTVLAAQTEALKAMGMLPGIDVPPNFPPPSSAVPPGSNPGGPMPPPPGAMVPPQGPPPPPPPHMEGNFAMPPPYPNGPPMGPPPPGFNLPPHPNGGFGGPPFQHPPFHNQRGGGGFDNRGFHHGGRGNFRGGFRRERYEKKL